MKKTLIILLCLGLLLPVLAKNSDDDWIFGTGPEKKEEQTTEDDALIKINFKKKDARLAMLYSAILPGAGQFYAKKSSLATWIFPIIEVGLIGGMVYYNVQGDKRTDDFEKYANGETINTTFHYTIDGTDYSLNYVGPRYDRNFQRQTETVLKNFYPNDIYDDHFFRLENANTQHFYEDIGKYNKYIFGWADWYYNFAIDPRDGSFVLGDEAFADAWRWSNAQEEHSITWIANVRIEDLLNSQSLEEPDHIAPGTPIASPMRQHYIQMRKDANASYGYGRTFTLGLALNHVASSIHAFVLAKQVNKTYLTEAPPVQLKYYTALRDGRVQPSIGLVWTF